jgi:hypothetical protein
VLLEALHAEDLGADWFVHLRGSRHDGVGGAHFQLSIRLYLTGIYLPLILLDSLQIDSVPLGVRLEPPFLTSFLLRPAMNRTHVE